MSDLLVVNLYIFILVCIAIMVCSFVGYKIIKMEHNITLIMRRQAFLLLKKLEQYPQSLSEEDVKLLELEKKV